MNKHTYRTIKICPNRRPLIDQIRRRSQLTLQVFSTLQQFRVALKTLNSIWFSRLSKCFSAKGITSRRSLANNSPNKWTTLTSFHLSPSSSKTSNINSSCLSTPIHTSNNTTHSRLWSSNFYTNSQTGCSPARINLSYLKGPRCPCRVWCNLRCNRHNITKPFQSHLISCRVRRRIQWQLINRRTHSCSRSQLMWINTGVW